jgi:signal transduction histidine kinase
MTGPPQRTPGTVVRATVALGAPAALIAMLVRVGGGQPRDDVFLYLGIVAALGVAWGLVAALLAAAASFLLVDYFFVQPLPPSPSPAARTSSTSRSSSPPPEWSAASARDAGRRSSAPRTEQHVRLLQESDRARREFLGAVSHELRAPLAGVLTATIVLAGRRELPASIRDDGVDRPEGTAAQRLLADMLGMARIEANTLDLHLEHVDLRQAAVAAVDRLHQHAPVCAVDVEVAADALVVADWDRLGQILDDLLLNADRFAPGATPITVRAGRQGPRSSCSASPRVASWQVRTGSSSVRGPSGSSSASGDSSRSDVSTGMGVAVGSTSVCHPVREGTTAAAFPAPEHRLALRRPTPTPLPCSALDGIRPPAVESTSANRGALMEDT